MNLQYGLLLIVVACVYAGVMAYEHGAELIDDEGNIGAGTEQAKLMPIVRREKRGLLLAKKALLLGAGGAIIGKKALLLGAGAALGGKALLGAGLIGAGLYKAKSYGGGYGGGYGGSGGYYGYGHQSYYGGGGGGGGGGGYYYSSHQPSYYSGWSGGQGYKW